LIVARDAVADFSGREPVSPAFTDTGFLPIKNARNRSACRDLVISP
jgi:hypothetical protein